jgi:two-component system sensor histidine kinase KdpD
VAAFSAPLVSTALAWLLFQRYSLADVVMIYLLGVVLVSTRGGPGASICAALLSIAAFDFVFIPPYYTFAVADFRHTITFVVMFFVAIVISGLTRRVRRQAEETQLAKSQVETERLRSSLLSSVSHDLRTPLAVITGAASTLLQARAVEPASRRDLVQTILEEAERLNRLIRNLLDMTRLESGAVKVKKDWLPLEEVVGAALNRLESRTAEREIRTKLPADLPLVPFDGVLIEQALINLLENAVKYSSGPIEIGAAEGDRQVMVEVADRGPGIPSGQEGVIFEKFQRAVTEGAPGGVGLGLAIARAIVAAHGGRLWVDSREGGGAIFRFTLPIEGEGPKLPPPEPELTRSDAGDLR